MFIGGEIQNQATLETEDGSETTEPTEFNPRADPENKEPTRTKSESPADYRNCSYSPIWRSKSQGESNAKWCSEYIFDGENCFIWFVTGSQWCSNGSTTQRTSNINIAKPSQRTACGTAGLRLLRVLCVYSSYQWTWNWAPEWTFFTRYIQFLFSIMKATAKVWFKTSETVTTEQNCSHCSNTIGPHNVFDMSVIFYSVLCFI